MGLKQEKRGAIIVAGGSGSRMGSECPKQFLEIGSVPILVHTLRAFGAYDPEMTLLVVLPPSHLAYARDLLDSYALSRVSCVAGGTTRTESVLSGLKAMPLDVERIAVHDGVRPFLSSALLERLFSPSSPVVLPVLPLVDTLMWVSPTASPTPLDRSCVRAVQTPQVFSAPLLRDAYARYELQKESLPPFTDDSSLVAHFFSLPPLLVKGEENNFKITTKKDLALARWLLSEESPTE